MRFNRHSELEGRHAFLSPSTYHWLGYSEEKLADRYLTQRAAAKGTRLHEIAKDLIREGIRLPRTPKTLNMYVNDGIGYRMTPEQPLFYSYNCYGTADTISFRRNVLRISDLKTGVSKASFNQLVIYAALFCLEYGFRPGDIEYELRIYQNDEVGFYIPELDEIAHAMDRIVSFDKLIERIRAEEEA